jgi:hypothetical protein
MGEGIVKNMEYNIKPKGKKILRTGRECSGTFTFMACILFLSLTDLESENEGD